MRWSVSKTAREPNEQGKLLIPEDVFDQLEMVRQSGVTNMVDRKTIKEYVPQFVSTEKLLRSMFHNLFLTGWMKMRKSTWKDSSLD